MSGDAVDVSVAGMKLTLAMPIYGQVPGETVESVVSTMGACRRAGVDVRWVSVLHQSVISRARNTLHARTLERTADSDVCLWVDSDMVWRGDDVLRLLAIMRHYTEVQSVAVLGRRKRRDLVESYAGMVMHDDEGRPTRMGPLWEAERHGWAFVAMRLDLMRRQSRWAHEEGRTYEAGGQAYAEVYRTSMADGRHWTEDYTACRELRARGERLWIDPAISLGHVGSYVWSGSIGDMLANQRPGEMG